MLISCPTCPKVYRIPASSIPPEGRDVRCASCGEVWYEYGVTAEVLEETPGVTASISQEQLDSVLAGSVHGPDMTSDIVDDVFASDLIESESPGGGEPYFDDDDILPPEYPFEKIAPKQLAAPQSRYEDAEPPVYTVPMQRDRIAGAVEEVTVRVRGQLETWWAQFQEWREVRRQEEAEPLPPGHQAAEQFRARVRAKQRNRMTPLRFLGWLSWVGSICGVVALIVLEREEIQAAWPATENFYALFEGAPSTPSIQIAGISSRYAESFDGPVLELRGQLINTGNDPVLPALELSAVGATEPFSERVTVTDVPIPKGGERPFIIRAQIPDGTRQAAIRVHAGDDDLRAPSKFIVQRTGSGWGEVLPDSLTAADETP